MSTVTVNPRLPLLPSRVFRFLPHPLTPLPPRALPGSLSLPPSPLSKQLHDMAALLLSSGANGDQSDHEGVSAIYLAAQAGDSHMIQVLLSGQDGSGRGSDNGMLGPLNVNAPVRTSQVTPLIAAVAEGHIDAVRVLLSAGADASCVTSPSTTLSTGRDGCGGGGDSGDGGGNGGGWDALRIAVGSGRDDIVAALQQGQRPTFYEPIV